MRLLLVLLAAAPAAFLPISSYGLLGSLGFGEPISPVGQAAIWVLLLTLLPSAYSGAVHGLHTRQWSDREIPRWSRLQPQSWA